MSLLKQDYENLLKILETVEIKGASSAKYITALAARIEQRVASWFDGHVTGFKQDVIQAAAGVPAANSSTTPEIQAASEKVQ